MGKKHTKSSKKGGNIFDSLGLEQTWTKTSLAIHDKYKEWAVGRAIICRTALDPMVKTIMNVLSVGEFNKKVEELGYDKLFHLKLVLELSFNGEFAFLVWEKVDVVTLRDATDADFVVDSSMPATIPQRTLGDFVHNTEVEMGLRNFFDYNAASNNCQVFLIASLRANNALTQKNEVFINQNVSRVFNAINSFTAKVSNTVTDIAAFFHSLVN